MSASPELSTSVGLVRPALSVVPYDDRWPVDFRQIEQRLRTGLGDGVVIEHVGSTSVTGLAAKPIIDLEVVVGSAEEICPTIEALAALGYLHRGDLGIAGREAFTAPSGLPYHHLYLVVAGSQPHRDHVDLRDYLRANPQAAERYAAVKLRLSPLLASDREAYTTSKAATVQALLAEARAAGPNPSVAR